MSDHKDIPPNTLMLFGVIGGLIGIYLTYFSYISPYFSIAGALGAICAVIWGADAVRRVAKYGLGTGVPSIGQIALGMGIVASMFGLAIVKPLPLAGPIVALITASLIGLIIGLFAQYVIKMKIPVMVRCMTEIAAAGSIIIVGYSAAVAGNFEFVSSIIPRVFDNGIILVVFWAGAVAILHPFNATLGPDETQKRLIYIAGSTGAITMTIIGIASTMTLGAVGGVTVVLGIILWVIFYKKFWDEVYKDSASVVGTGLIPKTEA
ncbi:tetrahydromethanopterin S-methyltransferase, subunit C [Candidatus Methanoperedens nitroreducens]|uniref:Tetrahydromethanopterin S-methyltransferase subunit C n=1 Tax=Candidatus Methanoperedens nitratireducens TaxID=1392998 RepID=A0A062VCR6_9EURY|nr:tetrahydromethanopterin S-methyltransferase subunit C [Candidatus Methanoperedens nitroreducens]KCZ73424.1 tetrahydromethanopterin S-methyltransferase, subunit C [Candidatus Methanoperedens nitroreducens]MDJ1422621.1 tetrahydromethanopterin S-methyltransferase subunit C [Candidatus Methanoperedens sp.]